MADSQTVVLDVRGMRCAGCVASVENSLRAVPGVTEANVNLATAEARVIGHWDSPPPLEDAVRKAGFEGTIREESESEERSRRLDEKQREEESSWRCRLLLAVPLAALVVILGFVPQSPFVAWLGLAVAAVAQVVIGAPFYRGAGNRLIHGAADMDTLVALGTTAAFGFTAVQTISGDHQHAFSHDSLLILTFVTLGKWLECRARGRASHAIRKLMDRAPRTALRLRGDETEVVPLAEVQAGDLLQVRPGDVVSTDGEIVAGESSIDESMISGESLPVGKGTGDDVVGGTVNQNGLLTIRATRVGRDSVLAQIIQLVEEAQLSKPGIGRLADRVAAVFVPIVLVVAVVTVVGHLATGGWNNWGTALSTAVAVLIVACPCAMGLATPTAIMVATGRGAEEGILIRQAQSLEEGGRIDTVLLDKTGTLTEGKPTVVAMKISPQADESQVLALAAAVESTSSHPLAQAIVSAAQARGVTIPSVGSAKAVPGAGVRAEVDGHVVLVGHDRWLKKEGVNVPAQPESTGTPVHVAIDGAWGGVLTLADPVKPNAREAVDALRAMGLRPIMVTGDARGIARAVGAEVGISAADVHSEVRPKDKESLVRSERANGRHLAMVGDGINDAPALAAAHLGIAMGGGSDIAKETGDVILASNDPRAIVRALRLCRAAMSKIKQNLVWAFAYNVVLIPLAAVGLLPPVFSALAMAASSVSVVGNSLLLRRVRL